MKKHRLSRKTRRKQRGGKMLNVRYGIIKVTGQTLEPPITQLTPRVNIPEGYTLIMYDPDAPAGTWLHWLKTSDKTYWEYQPPNPPSGTHRYIFRLVEGFPVESELRQSGINPSMILPGRVKGEVMFMQSA